MADGDPVLVDPELSRAKLVRQVEQFQAHADAYRRRGYWIVRQDDLDVYIAFAARVRLTLMSPPAPAITAYVRLRHNNLDLWAPSLTFLDFFTAVRARPAPQPCGCPTSAHRSALPVP